MGRDHTLRRVTRGAGGAVAVTTASLAACAAASIVLARWLSAVPRVAGAAPADVALGVAVVALLGVAGAPAAARGERLRRSGIVDIDEMSGTAFEQRLGALFADMGASVRHTGNRGDFGADLVLERDGCRTVIQAKRYAGAVGIEAVQQVIGATRYYDAAHAMVVTSSAFTPAARALAAAHGVALVDRAALADLLCAHPLPSARSRPAVLAARQVASGARLVLYAAGCLLRLVGWTLRTSVRASTTLWRALR